jgi:Arc/MetJ family transcription regulator
MRRTQLHLDDQIWDALHTLAQSQKTTVSELIRRAVRERYLGSQEQRMLAMQSFIGSRKARGGAADAVEEVRNLRRGARLGSTGLARGGP